MEILVQCDGMAVKVEFSPGKTLADLIGEHKECNAMLGVPDWPTTPAAMAAEGYIDLPSGVVRVYSE